MKLSSKLWQPSGKQEKEKRNGYQVPMDCAYKRSFAANLKNIYHEVVAVDFLSHCLSGTLPYVQDAIKT